MSNPRLYNELNWLLNHRAYLKQYEIEFVQGCIDELGRRGRYDVDKYAEIQDMVKRVRALLDKAINLYDVNSFKSVYKDRTGRYANPLAITYGRS